jgi:hypothetical protein
MMRGAHVSYETDAHGLDDVSGAGRGSPHGDGGPYLEDSVGSESEAGTWHVFVTPGNVTDAKNTLSAQIETLKADINNCTGMDKTRKAAFAAFYEGWRKFYCANDTGTCTAPGYNLFGLGGQIDQADAYTQQVYDWQKELAGINCQVSSPMTVPPANQAANLGLAAMGALQWVAIAAVALVGGYAISKTGLPKLFGGRKR